MEVATATTINRRPVNPFWKPVGLPMSREQTYSGIEDWINNEHPSFVRKANPLTIAGVISTTVGLIAGLFSMSNGKSTASSFILMLAGVGSTLLGLMGISNKRQNTPFLESIKFNPKSREFESENMGKRFNPKPKKTVSNNSHQTKQAVGSEDPKILRFPVEKVTSGSPDAG